MVKRQTTNLFGNEIRVSGPLFPPSGISKSANIATFPDVKKIVDHDVIVTGTRRMTEDKNKVFEVIVFYFPTTHCRTVTVWLIAFDGTMSSLQIFQSAEITLRQGVLPPKQNERKKWMDIIEKQVKELQIHKENRTWRLSGTWDEVQEARGILESLYSERKLNSVSKHEYVVHKKLEENFQLSDPKKSNVPGHSDNTPLNVSAIHQKETTNLPQITGSQDSDKLVIPTSRINKVPTEFTSSEKSLPFPIGQYPSSTQPLFQMPNTTTIYLYKSNITRLAVDIIVNAANGRLLHQGGVAVAISKAVGPSFQRDSERYIAKHGKIPVSGTAVIAVGNDLPYSNVINAVGPVWFEYDDKVKCRDALMMAFFNSFKYADEKLFALTMAVPPIGGGKCVYRHSSSQ